MSQAANRSTLRRLLGGGAWQLTAFASQLFVLPIVAHFLDPERMGAWALLGSAGFMIGLVDLGLATAVQRSAVTEEHARTRRLVGLSLLVQSVLLPLAGAAAYVYLWRLPGAPADVQAEAAYGGVLVVVAGATLGLGQPYRMFVLARSGVKKIAQARMIAAGTQTIVLLGGFLLVSRSVVVPSIGLLLSNGIDLVLVARAARRIDPLLPLWPRRPRAPAEARAALRDGSAAFSLNLAISAALRVDVFVLSAVAPLALVGTYQIAGRAVEMAYLAAKQTTASLMPELGDHAARGRAVRIGTGVFSGVVVSGLAAVAVVGQPVLVLLFGQHVTGSSAALVLVLLSTAAMIMSTSEVAAAMVMLGGRTAWACAGPILVGSAVDFTLSVSLAAQYGIWAVAGSTVIGHAISMVLLWRKARKLLGWSLPRVLETLAPPLVAAPIALGVAWLLRGLASTGPAASLLACVLTTAAGATAAMLVLRWRLRTAVAAAAAAEGGAT